MGGNNDEKLKGPELHHFDEAVISAKIAFGKYFTPDDWARFEKKFREMDQNGSGHLSLEDLKRCQEKMDAPITHAQLKEILNDLACENPNKGLSFGEYVKVQMRLSGIGAEEIKEREKFATGEAVAKAVEGKLKLEMMRLEDARAREAEKAKGDRREHRDHFKDQFKVFGQLITPRRVQKDSLVDLGVVN